MAELADPTNQRLRTASHAYQNAIDHLTQTIPTGRMRLDSTLPASPTPALWLSLDVLLREIEKLVAVRALGVGEVMFAGAAHHPETLRRHGS